MFGFDFDPFESFDWRIIPIPKREHGYGDEHSGIKTQIIETKEEFETVFALKIDGWNNKAGVLKAFKDANIDENKENIAILRNVQGSGSNQVSLKTPIHNKNTKTLECQVEVNYPPGGLGTCDMAYYCFAVAFNKESIDKVTWNGQLVPHLFERKQQKNTNNMELEEPENVNQKQNERKDNNNNSNNNSNSNNNRDDEKMNDRMMNNGNNGSDINNRDIYKNSNRYSFVRDVLYGLDLSQYVRVFKEHEITDSRLKFLENSDLEMLFKNKLGNLIVFRHWLMEYKQQK